MWLESPHALQIDRRLRQGYRDRVTERALLDVVFECVPDQFLLPIEMQLLQDVADVVLHGLLCDEEFLADCPVGVTAGDMLEDLPLPGRESLVRARGLQPVKLGQDEGGK